ncbi:amidohydrolase family protein, partial [Georgenia sp. 10Sc9-8]|nr:amidohydrolase family protein [Georgenia halotolerans]
WDTHVHVTQWAQTVGRLDVSGAGTATEVLRPVAEELHAEDRPPGAPLIGFGFRDALWPDEPRVADLDAVAGRTPVVLISADVHCGWLSSTAMDLLGVPRSPGLIREHEWFDVLARLGDLPGAPLTAALQRAMQAAAARGVVGVVDMEWAPNHRCWPERLDAGLDLLRVRTGVYPDHLEEVLHAGLRTGRPLPGGRGLLTMGPLKIISDGSLNTRTAFCHAPYATGDPAHPRGQQTVPVAELVDLLGRARAGGLQAAVHAIGDGANTLALDAFARSGAAGSVEHVQLVRPEDVERMALLGVTASVQPAHLLDDRDVTEELWPGRTDRVFVLREMLEAGVHLTLGSDAPVAPLDPWLAMAAAVHRSADDRPPWHPEQHLSPAQALAASTDGWGTLAEGAPGDVALLDADPLADADAGSAAAAGRLRGMQVAATVVAGRLTHDTVR